MEKIDNVERRQGGQNSTTERVDKSRENGEDTEDGERREDGDV
jgi:hypothetical protein